MNTITMNRDGRFAKPERGSATSRLLTFAEGGHARAVAFLVALCLLCFLPGFVSLHPMDRDEPRYAQASKQMLETGEFIDIRFQDEARHKKPAGVYWLQAATVATAEAVGLDAARTTIAVYRIPSLLGAIAAVLLTYWAALALVTRREAVLAAAFLGACVILMVEARLAKTDAVLLACCVAAMGGLARAWVSRGAAPLPWPTFFAFWLGIGFGVLVKGPIVLLFAGSATLALIVVARSADFMRALRPLPGAALAALIAVPWFLAIAVLSDGAFYEHAVGHDLLGKVGTAQTYHWAPPGTYLVAFFATFWPAALFAVIGAEFAWLNRRVREAAFLLAWIIPGWLVFELVPTKLPHYVMPTYPALAITAALAIGRGFAGPYRVRFRIFGFLIALVPVGLLIGLPIAAHTLGDTLPIAALVALALAAAIGLWAWWLWAKARVEDSAMTAIAAAIVLAVAVLGLAQPALQSLKLSPNLAAAGENALACEEPTFATLGYREPSLVFLVGTDLDMVETGEQAASFLAGGPCRAVFVTDRFELDFAAAATAQGLAPVQADRVVGFNINGGDPAEIGVYVRGTP